MIHSERFALLSRIWVRPEAVAARVGREGELFAARVRPWVLGISGLLPLWSLFADPQDPEPWVGVTAATVAVLISVAVRFAAARAEPPRWLGAFTAIFDVTLVSALQAGLVVAGQPLATTNGRVLFSLYFIALAFLCLRQDVRLCLLGGAAAIFQYAALVFWAVQSSEAAGTPLASATYGTFRWDNQISRLVLLALATAVHAAIVRQGRGLREDKARAEEASRTKSEFLANMSHEIRTPLNAVLGMTSLLLETPLTAVQREYVEAARHGGGALLGVINDILDFSKIEAGGLSVEAVPFLLRACVEEAVELLAAKAASQGVALRCRLGPGLPEAVESDPARLRQILVNLLDNAIKFTPRGSVDLEVWAGEERNGLRELFFRVSDTGIGIPADRLERLFKPFSQADTSMTRVYGGTGLGLVISRRLAERLGGWMGVESEPGRGARFTFTIRCPEAPAPPPRQDGDAPDAPPLADRYPLRILLAEDNSVNQKVALLMLERLGYRADVAGDGVEALEALRRQPYDVVLMDLQMPHLDGLQAARRIQAEWPPAERPWITAISASVLESQRQACVAAGMNDFVAKPIVLSHLREALLRAGSAAGARRQGEAASAGTLPERPARLDRSRIDGLRRMEALAGTEMVRKIVEIFVAEAPRRLERLRRALDEKDPKELAFWAHSLKGSSGQLGALRLAALSLDLESRGTSRELEEAPYLLAELEAEVAEVLPLLAEEAAKGTGKSPVPPHDTVSAQSVPGQD